jgi:hypothetical protein
MCGVSGTSSGADTAVPAGADSEATKPVGAAHTDLAPRSSPTGTRLLSRPVSFSLAPASDPE